MVIDLSSNNGTVDFTKVTAEEVFIRASLGYGDKDKMLSINANGAAKNNLPVAYYHFAYPHGSQPPAADGAQQGDYFAKTISVLPKATNLAVDLEPFDAKGTDTTYSPADYAIWLQAFLDTVESRTGIKCHIYSYADYLNRHLPDGHTFGYYPLWVAQYKEEDAPTLPEGWGRWDMWQYSEQGVMEGITGHVDLSKKNVAI